MITLKQIVGPRIPLPQALRRDWERQFRTAATIIKRFENDFRTQLLADEVGMGKTYVAMATIAHHIFQSTENDRKVLLIVPSSTLERKWGQELRSFNEQYLRTDLCKSCDKRLRPLMVDDYWDLIENLHDYVNEELPKISETKSHCMALFFRSWWENNRRRKGSWLREWLDTGGLQECDESYLDFAAHFSKRAFHEFLDAKAMMDKSGIDHLVRDLEAGKSRKEEIKELFREFAKIQDTYEANVFVMTMKSLSKPRRDHPKSRRLSSWMASRILAGRHSETRTRILGILQAENLVTRSDEVQNDYASWFTSLGGVDLWGMTKAFDTVTNELGGKAALFERFEESTCVPLLGELHDRVVRAKFAEAGIGLAVVDEVHNWKNGGNGAKEFSQSYAPWIEHKLLLSATPFQLNQSELGSIYRWAAGNTTDHSLATINAILEDGLAAECLHESDAFQSAWQALSRDDARELQEQLFKAPLSESVTEWSVPAGCSATLEAFWDRFRHYANSIRRLQEELGKVMLRHTKDRSHRYFHAGRDWLAEGMPRNSALSHSSLYPVDGFADPRHALLGYVGMRLVQKLQVGGTGNARLLRGITSSFAAFKASNSETLKTKDLPDEVRAYLDFFQTAMETGRHPKVAATAERAFANYRHGNKTLIFCERVSTLEEIRTLLSEKIEALFRGGISAAIKRRSALLRRQGFVSLSWSRSLLETMPSVKQKAIIKKWKAGIPSIISAITETLAAQGLRPSERRVMRLADLELFALMEASDLPTWAQGFNSMSPEQRQLFVDATPVGEGCGPTPLVIDPDEPEESITQAGDVVRECVEGFLERPNLWFHPKAKSFHGALHALLTTEYAFLKRQRGATSSDNKNHTSAFLTMLTDLAQGMRKILLRPEFFATRDMSDSDLEVHLLRDLWETPRALEVDDTAWSRRTAGMRLEDFLSILTSSEGTIQRHWRQDSKRKSLWSGVFLKHGDSAGLVLTLSGSVAADTRVSRCAAFNSPLAPDILICTAIGAEGIDLHRYCSEVIHHDLPWNPAKLEQRIGRIDRVGSLTERLPGRKLLVGIPFLANDYETIQYQVLHSRAQRFEVLLGKPDFTLDIDEEDQEDEILESKDEDEPKGTSMMMLPRELLEPLRMDLRVK